MPVESTHKEYKIRIDQWSRCRAAAEGTDAVKASTTIFLPKLGGQSESEYAAYLMRALFYGATGRTIQGLSGAIFRKPSKIEYVKLYEKDLELMTVNGLSFSEVEQETIRELLIVGRHGILVDSVKADGKRAYAAMYTAENITDWQTTVIDGVQVPTQIRLNEWVDTIKSDGFEIEKREQYRVLKLTFVKDQYVYSQEVHVKTKDDKNIERFILDPSQSITPMRKGKVLNYIPFFSINKESLTLETDKPPLLDLVDVNFSHFRTCADLEHGAHYTALPTPWVAGFPVDKKLRIGSAIAWVSNDPKAKAGFLEYTGQGLQSLRDLKKDKEGLMARLGAQILEEEKGAAETATTTKLRKAGEGGALLSMVISVTEGLTNVLKEMARWSGASDSQVDKIEYKLNRDFVSTRMEPQELTALMQSWQSGGISQDTFLWNMQQGEILPPDPTIEDEKDLLDVGVPGLEDEGSIPVKKEFGILTDPVTKKPTGIVEK